MLDDPAPVVLVDNLGANGIQMTLLAWAKSYEMGGVRTALVLSIRDRLKGLGMSLGPATQDVRIHHSDRLAGCGSSCGKLTCATMIDVSPAAIRLRYGTRSSSSSRRAPVSQTGPVST